MLLFEDKSFAMELEISYFDIKMSPHSLNDLKMFSN